MRWYSFIVLLLFFNVADSTFWFDDFERATQKGSQKSDVSQDYLRALSIFKRKLQLLGFFPIVLNDDDGLGYASVDSFLIDDDDDDDDAFDDRMDYLLKKMKKEKKARKKSLKKKLKKSKKNNQPPIVTTTVQPISNIVYYWPSTITTIVHPVEGSIGKQPSYDKEPSEDNSSETDSISNNQKDKNGKQRPAKINYETSFSFERKLKFDDDNDTPSTTSTSPTSTTTPYPLITVFEEDVAIEEILSQQEIVNKIDEDRKGNITKTTAPEEDHFHVSNDSSSGLIIQDNLTETVSEVYVTAAVPIIYEESARDQKDVIPTLLLDAKNEANILDEILTSEPTTDLTPTDVTESSTYSSLFIPTGVLEFFHETLPDTDEQSSSIGPPSASEIIPVPVSNSQEFHISHEVAETSKNNTNVDGHRETGTPDRIDAILQINEETTTIGAISDSLDQNSTTPNSSDDKVQTDLVFSMLDDHDAEKSNGYEYSIDPKISLPMEITDDFESRSLTDKPAVIVILNDKSGRRSDVPIEADDVNDEDTTDNLPYNLTNENVLEQSNLIENNSAETSTPPSTADAPNFDNIEQFDAEIIPLIPIIIKQMRQGNVSPEEMEILKNTFGQFWPFIVEEASRENDSSEEMNPLLSEVLNSVNRRIVKREATVGRWRRPTYGRRIYFDDDDDDFVPRKRYYGQRRRPIIAYY